MPRIVNTKEREQELLSLIISSYIDESKPISSSYLCHKYKLPYSSATVRNTMESLERQGFLSHVHISSGRVPTTDGFRYYAACLDQEGVIKDYPLDLASYVPPAESMESVINYTLDMLAEISGYASMVTLSADSVQSYGPEKMYMSGTRFILQQPEFEDIERVRNLMYALEVRVSQLQKLLVSCCSEDVKVLIGDDIGCEYISDCALVASGASLGSLSFVLALLGPMRMNYSRAISSVCYVRDYLSHNMEMFL